MECKIGVMGKLTQCPKYDNGDCIDIENCIYKDRPKKEKFDFTRYLIAAKNPEVDGEKYLDNDGYLVDIKYADFYTNKKEAERVRKFVLDEPDNFYIAEVEIHIEVN